MSVTSAAPRGELQAFEAYEWVRQLMAARAQRQAIAPHPELFSLSAHDGYALQCLHVDAMLKRFGGKVIGSKLAGTDMASMAALGLTGPYRGPIFSAFTYETGARVCRDDFFLCLVEAEIGVLTRREIGAGAAAWTREQLMDAVSAVVPCIEIADARHLDVAACPPAAVLADLAFAGAWVRGMPVRDWRLVDLPALKVRLLGDGHELRSGVGARAMGDPLESLRVMAVDLDRHGKTLPAGQVISLGTYTAPYPAKAGESLVADFGPLGQVVVHVD